MVTIKCPTLRYSKTYLTAYQLVAARCRFYYVPECQFTTTGQILDGPKPRTSGKSALGNRSCFHPNLSGVAYGFTLEPTALKPEDLCYPFYMSNAYGSFIKLSPKDNRPLRLQVNVKGSNLTYVFDFYTEEPAWSEASGWSDWYCDIYRYYYQNTPITPDQRPKYKTEKVRLRNRKQLNLQSVYDGDYKYRHLVASTSDTLSRLVPSFNRREVFGSLNDDCAAQAKYVDCNTSMLLRELARLKTDTTRLAQVLRGKIDVKTLSSLFLNYKYGARLTVKDANLILDKVTDHLIGLVPKQNLYRVHSRTTFELPSSGIFLDKWQVECVSTIWYRPAPQWTLDRSLYSLVQWDIFPTFQNIWDFIPYSFVVDWFLDVEGALTSLDNKAQWALCHVEENLETVKYTNRVDAGILSKHFTGDLTFTMYNREVKETLTTRQFHFTPSLTATHHVAELTALIAQRL